MTSFYTTAGMAVITAPASFDTYTAPEVRDLTIRLQRDGATGIVIDLAAVTYMNSTALGVILAAQNRLCGAGGWLAVAAATEPVTRMFRVTGLTRCLPMHPAVTDAIAELRQLAGTSQEPPAPLTDQRFTILDGIRSPDDPLN
jgi:anti-sigma B factor antagonist